MKPPLTLISDGTSVGTRLVDADGKQLVNVTKVTYTVDAHGATRATIEAIFVGAEVSLPGVVVDLPWIVTVPARIRRWWSRFTYRLTNRYYA